MQSQEQINPLFSKFETPFETIPFIQIKTEHFIPAFEKAIAEAKSEIEKISNNSEKPTFANTVEALDFSGRRLDRISSAFFNLNSAETNDEIQKIAKVVSPMLSDFHNDIILNKKLFERIKSVWQNKEQFHLNTEQMTLLEKKFKDFSRNGALLSEINQEKLRILDKELATLSLKFGENVLAETTSYEYIVTNKEDLIGLTEDAVENAKKIAQQKGKGGWVFTLDFPSYQAVVKYAANRSLRETITKAYAQRGYNSNEYNNEKIVKDIVKLRHQRANLLGYKTHAHFVLEQRMAENPEKVNEFLNDLLTKSKPFAQQEFNELENYAKSLGLDQLQSWDGSYYAEKLKKEKFNLDDEALKPYFKLDNVLSGVFTIAGKLYGLQFEKISNIDVYHPEVETYKVTDEQGNFVAVFYTDFFPRKGKRSGAWMTSFKDQWKLNEENSRPHVSIVCNFTRPTDTKPSLLTFNEVTTLFHEFGHALHGMLADTTYPSLSGTSVYWDFVELPSQVMENWAYEEEALKLFAHHYQSGELIPMELVKRIKESANFMEGMSTVRQLSFGLLDMAWHGQIPDENVSIKEYETTAMLPTQLYPIIKENSTSTAFSHIFQGGYSSGYYSYKWAEVLDADAFEYFKETGIFNKETADKFKKYVLTQGGTEKPMKLYIHFRGQEPTANALLKRAGMLD
jgi:peptidyl-dipeptidase Dcp